MVPLLLDDKGAWSKVVTLPKHQEALESVELRQWLHYLAHATLKDNRVEMPAELRAHPIFRKSADQAEALLLSSAFSYSEKEMAEALEKERAAFAEDSAERLKKAVAEALVKERAAAAEALVKERAAAGERVATLMSELRRLKSGSGAS